MLLGNAVLVVWRSGRCVDARRMLWKKKCVYVCTHACIHACMHSCIHACKCASMHFNVLQCNVMWCSVLYWTVLYSNLFNVMQCNVT